MKENCDNKTSSVMDNNKDEYAKKYLYIAAVLVFIFMLVELIGGLVSKSMALVADSIHMFSDFVSVLLVIFAISVAKLQKNLKKTYGYTRFEIVISLINALFLLFISGLVAKEAIERIFNPQPVDALTMLPVAVSGLITILIVLFLINKSGKSHGHGGHNHSHDHSHKYEDNEMHDHEHTENKAEKKKRSLLMQGAFLHVLSDALSSVAAISSGVIIYYTGWNIVDPILSVLIVFLIFNSTWKVIRDSIHILMEGSPNNINHEELSERLTKNITGIIDVHHIHTWTLNEGENIATMHVVVKQDADISLVKQQIYKYIKTKLKIYHVTVQIEMQGSICPDELSFT
jgi:cobalt-zinc-cadmium efflux system protein